ncbi:DUF721 domain-containing protein [Streptomyces sp. URMC 127]|uniref:DUF721 domain-containing protein n=1 Tax=Streptomyces sp. URMC 127 TaxID=3423402 RepID=UPI003F1D6CE5
MGLAAAIDALVAERAWELPAVGATLRERWAAIAPDLAEHVAAIGYDAGSGQLTVCPESAAWAAKTRLEQTRVIAAANTLAGRAVVRALRILPPGTVSEPEPADTSPAPAAAPGGPVRTRENACEGYRRALAAHRAAALQRQVAPGIAEAVERQAAAMRELSRRMFPEADVVADDAPAPIDVVRTQRRRQAAATEAAALRRARAERAGQLPARRARSPPPSYGMNSRIPIRRSSRTATVRRWMRRYTVSDISTATWTTHIGGELVEIPATIDGIRAALPEDQQPAFDAEIGSTPADQLQLVLASWSLSATPAAGEEDDAIIARLRAGDFIGCVPQDPEAGVA